MPQRTLKEVSWEERGGTASVSSRFSHAHYTRSWEMTHGTQSGPEASERGPQSSGEGAQARMGRGVKMDIDFGEGGYDELSRMTPLSSRNN